MKYSQALLYANVIRPYPGYIPVLLAAQIGGRLIDLIVVLMCIFSLSLKRNIRIPQGVHRTSLIMPIIIMMYSLFLLLFGITYYGHEVSGRDIYEPFRYIIYLLVLLTAYNNASSLNYEFWEKFWISMIVIYLVIVIMRLSGISIFFQATEILFGMAKDKHDFDRSLFRLTGFFINPNWAGVFLSWSMAYFLFNFRRKNFQRLLVISIISILVLLTGSRTGLICAFSVLFFWLFIEGKARYILMIILSVLLLISIIGKETFITIFPFHYRELLEALIVSGSITEVATFSDRLDLWKEVFNKTVLDTIIFGSGPFKETIGVMFENQYLKWLVWYGFFGVLLMLLYYLYFVLTAADLIKKGDNERAANFSKSLIAMIFSISVAGITGAFFDVTQLLILLFAQFGFILSISNENLYRN